MPKLKLELEGIRVESFDTAPGGARGGTVAGHERETFSCPPATAALTCDPSCNVCGGGGTLNTCVSCELTCAATCGSCNPITCNPTVDPFGRCCGYVY